MQTIVKQLNAIKDPLTGKNLAERVELEKDTIYINCPYVVDPKLGNNQRLLEQAIQPIRPPSCEIKMRLRAPMPPSKPELKDEHLPILGNIIAVGSGKGGVGKSTVSSGIAMALNALGARVGLLDGDIYGANQDMLMGMQNSRTKINKNKEFIPFSVDGIALMSFAGVTGPDVPIVWRGPMISNALQQMISKTEWPRLDYLIVDMPPGTGDIQLTLFQKTIVAGFVLVTTPQPMAVAEAGKTLTMTQKMGIDCLGIIESMNRFICSQCDTEHSIFGNATQKLVHDSQLELLGSLPIDTSLHGDGGKLMFDAETQSGKEFISMAEKISTALARKSITRQGAVITSG